MHSHKSSVRSVWTTRLAYLKEDLGHSTEQSEWPGEKDQERHYKLHKMVGQGLSLVNDLRSLMEVIAQGVGNRLGLWKQIICTFVLN